MDPPGQARGDQYDWLVFGLASRLNQSSQDLIIEEPLLSPDWQDVEQPGCCSRFTAEAPARGDKIVCPWFWWPRQRESSVRRHTKVKYWWRKCQLCITGNGKYDSFNKEKAIGSRTPIKWRKRDSNADGTKNGSLTSQEVNRTTAVQA